MDVQDAKTIVAGAAVWRIAIPIVKIAGKAVADNKSAFSAKKVAVWGLIAGISSVTTPLFAAVLGWQTPNEKVRGIALALGTAQTLDGLVHTFWPSFYNPEHGPAVASAGSIFTAAGLLGIFSAYA